MQGNIIYCMPVYRSDKDLYEFFHRRYAQRRAAGIIAIHLDRLGDGNLQEPRGKRDNSGLRRHQPPEQFQGEPCVGPPRTPLDTDQLKSRRENVGPGASTKSPPYLAPLQMTALWHSISLPSARIRKGSRSHAASRLMAFSDSIIATKNAECGPPN